MHLIALFYTDQHQVSWYGNAGIQKSWGFQRLNAWSTQKQMAKRTESKLHSPLIYKSFLHVVQNNYAGFSNYICIAEKGELKNRLGKVQGDSTIYTTVLELFLFWMNLIITIISLTSIQ